MRLFLHLRDGQSLLHDPDGEVFAKLDDAVNEAIQAAREIMATRLRAGQPLDDSAFEIHDEQGRVLATVPFERALPDPRI